jgi:hypothetical protein
VLPGHVGIRGPAAWVALFVDGDHLLDRSLGRTLHRPLPNPARPDARAH